MSDYKRMLRDIVRDQGHPESFRANAVRLDDKQLAIALKEYDDTLPEVAGEIEEQVRHCLEYGKRSGFVQMVALADLTDNEATALAVGAALIAACRNRVIKSVRRDLELKADEMAAEDRTDATFTPEVEHV
jgi:hypothetical protein